MEKRWVYEENPSQENILELANSINVNPILANILIQRGISNFDQAKEFFRPALEQIHDPLLMKDMDLAVSRINAAVANEEKILVYGDYDVDGTTAVALVYSVLSSTYSHVNYYIPDRYTEGYGVSEAGIEWAMENGCKLIISLDCGIRANDLVKKAKDAGIDFIICDHHRPGAELPEAAAVLDPKREDCQYPYKELTGCGIGFKLMQAFALANGIEAKKLYSYLDLVAISVASDLVPITEENRILTYYGLKVLNHKPRAGLQALIEVSGFRSKIDIQDIVFGLGPRINAAGRIKHAKDSVRLLIANNEDDAESFAANLNEKNTERREFDLHTTDEALKMIDESNELQNSKSTVLFKNDWHKGVIGIVASRCIEKYYRPTIILTESENKATGSARSVKGFDVHEAISACSDLLEKYGGHKYAAGLTLDLENVGAFQQKFEQVVSDTIDPELLIPQVRVDAEISFELINFKLFNILRQMAPFGPENMEPVFVTKGLKLAGNLRLLKEAHIKLFVQSVNGGPKFEAIGFNMYEFEDRLRAGEVFDMAYNIQLSNFGSERYLQLMIKDIKFATSNSHDTSS